MTAPLFVWRIEYLTVHFENCTANVSLFSIELFYVTVEYTIINENNLPSIIEFMQVVVCIWSEISKWHVIHCHFKQKYLESLNCCCNICYYGNRHKISRVDQFSHLYLLNLQYFSTTATTTTAKNWLTFQSVFPLELFRKT